MKCFMTCCLIVICFLPSNLCSQTSIPETKKERATRVIQLEKLLEKSSDPLIFKELGMLYLVNLAEVKNKVLLEKALKVLKQGVEKNIDDAELQTAYGSVITMQALYVNKGLDKMHYVSEGSSMMDMAIQRDPNNVGALLLRANNSLYLPKMLERSHLAVNDFEKILTLAGDKNGIRFRTWILFQLGSAHDLLDHKEKASEYWELAAKTTDPKAFPWPDRAKKKLQASKFGPNPLGIKQQGDLYINITGLKNTKGQLLIGLFNNPDEFPNGVEFRGHVVKLLQKELMVLFKDLAKGKYCIAIVHDENNDDKLTKNFLGIPKEGLGFSNNASARFGPPSFQEAGFLMDSKDQQVIIPINY